MANLSSKNLSKFTFNGGASRANKVLQFGVNARETGSAFYFKPIAFKDDTSFETYFRYQGSFLSDVVFVLQDDSRKDNALGSFSGYRGISPSVGIGLDGGGNDINLNANGGSTALASIGANLDLDSGGEVNVWIDYNGKNDRLKVFTSSTTSKPRNPLLSSKIDVENILGNRGYVGFSGGGDTGQTVEVIQWEFSTSDAQTNKPSKNINGDNKNNRLQGTNKNDKIDGKGGRDILTGAGGNDILTGGGGADDFLLGSGKAYKKKDLGIDTIKDFKRNLDDIILDKDTFITLHSKAGEGFSIGREFEAVKNKRRVARSVADIVYDRSSGDLYYNANGGLSGFGGGGKIATLEGAPKIGPSDFVLE